MSVLVANRKESRYEAIIFSTRIGDMLNELVRRDFGVKDIDRAVCLRYAYGLDNIEDFSKYRFLMKCYKERITHNSILMTENLRASYKLYPTSLHECDEKRDFLNFALINCDQIKGDLQRIVDTFFFDIGALKQPIQAIDREIDLIKRWRQRDNKLRSTFVG